LALAVPLSRFTSRVGGGSAFYVRRMKKTLTILAVLALAVMFGAFVVYSVVSVLPRHGTAACVSDLQQAVYAQAGPRIGSTFTNSLVQKFPFDGPVDWKLIFFKDTALFLSGRVDTNGLHQFISSHPDTKFIWSGSRNEGEEGWPSDNKCWPATTTWTNVWFRNEWNFEGYPTSIEGRVDLRSGSATFQIW
jgi:hypothetical protein